MSQPAAPSDEPTRRRALLVGGLVALVLALGAGASFALLSARDQPDPDELAQERRTQRAVATLPTPEAEPAPVAEHFPGIAGLQAAPVDPQLVAGLEDRLRPPDGGYAATRHRELRDGDQRVAVISLLRAGDAADARRLRRDAMSGVGRLFDSVTEERVAGEQVMRGKTPHGTALLWLPDTDSVLVVSAVSRQRAETVLAKVVASVRDRAASPAPADSPGSSPPASPRPSRQASAGASGSADRAPDDGGDDGPDGQGEHQRRA